MGGDDTAPGDDVEAAEPVRGPTGQPVRGYVRGESMVPQIAATEAAWNGWTVDNVHAEEYANA